MASEVLSVENSSDSVSRSKAFNIKYCRVCGDRALGYNFNVVTCESCKAFFRRNALKTKEFRCPFEDKCDVSTVSRRFCQKCRLRKCFEVGMKKDWIMTDESRLSKLKKANARKKSLSANSNRPPPQPQSVSIGAASMSSDSSIDRIVKTDSNGPTCSTVIHQTNCHLPMTGSGENLLIPKSALINFLLNNASSPSDETVAKKCICRCTCGAKPPGALITSEGEDKAVNTDFVDPFYSAATSSACITVTMGDAHDPMLFGSREEIKSGFDTKIFSMFDSAPTSFASTCESSSGYCSSGESFLADCQQQQQQLFRPALSNFDYATHLVNNAVDQSFTILGTLSSGEKSKLNELLSANEIMNEPMERFVAEHKKNSASLTDFVNLMDIAIRRIIKMTKRIEAFKNLCQEDQIALLKGGCIEMLVLRGVMSFDPVKDSWHGPKSHYIKVEAVRGLKDGIYEEYKNYFHSFDAYLRKNEPVMLILGAIVLFVPDRANVLNSELISCEHKSYYSLLRSYLNSIFDVERSKSAYVHLCQNLDDLRKLTDKVVRIFLHVNPQEVEPLLIEMFDLR